MKIVRSSLALFLAAMCVVPTTAFAQDHVIAASALNAAVQQRAARDQADRDAVLSLLQRAEVKEIASMAGLSLDKAKAAVSLLQGPELQQTAAQARQVQNDLAGGMSTRSILTVTIVILALLVVLAVAT
jgi:hypothetical protein